MIDWLVLAVSFLYAKAVFYIGAPAPSAHHLYIYMYYVVQS